MIPESIIEGKNINWESITSVVCVLRISPKTQPILINRASDTKYGGRLWGSEAWKAKGATAKTMTFVTDFQQFFYNYKIPPQFSVSKGRKGKTSASNLPILFILAFSPRFVLCFCFPLSQKGRKKAHGLPGLFLLLSYSIPRFLPPALPLT